VVNNILRLYVFTIYDIYQFTTIIISGFTSIRLLNFMLFRTIKRLKYLLLLIRDKLPVYIYVVSNEKGGVAKTTTAINLAAGLAKAGQSVLLVDMDDQASATSVLINNRERVPNIYHLLKDRKRQVAAEAAIVETSEAGVFIIPSSNQLGTAEVEFSKYIDNQRLLLGRLQEIAEEFAFEYVVVDSPPRSRFLNLNCLFAADEVVVPMFTDLFSIEGVAQLIDDISVVSRSREKKIEVGFLLCRVERTKSAERIAQELRQIYGQRVYQTVIPKNVAVSDAHAHHVSVLTYAPQSTGALAYQQFVQEILTTHDN
jgi:chromosome partitioning protein